MKCRKKWDLEFTKNALNASFMQKEYKTHRQNILVDRTISQIQEHYPAAIQLSQKRKEDAAVQVVMDEIRKLNEQINEKYTKINMIRRESATKPNTEAEKRKFVMPCQTGGCRGMLSTAYKCELCEKFTCSKCLESIVGEKDAHECNPANVETAEEIRKNTRPCPSCGCRISKIDGCDQMWCIECKTAFSWKSGLVVNGRIHNPHYYDWMRRNGGMPAVPQVAQQMDGCIADNDVIQNVLYAYRRHPMIPQMCRMVRHVDALLRSERRHIRTPESDENKRVLRVKRLLNYITDDEWKYKLQRMEKAVQKGRRVIQVLELFVQAATDLLRQALPVDADRDVICTQINELRAYCEGQLEKIQKRYNNVVPNLSEAELHRMAGHYW
jgi:hypothetical protein